MTFPQGAVDPPPGRHRVCPTRGGCAGGGSTAGRGPRGEAPGWMGTGRAKRLARPHRGSDPAAVAPAKREGRTGPYRRMPTHGARRRALRLRPRSLQLHAPLWGGAAMRLAPPARGGGHTKQRGPAPRQLAPPSMGQPRFVRGCVSGRGIAARRRCVTAEVACCSSLFVVSLWWRRLPAVAGVPLSLLPPPGIGKQTEKDKQIKSKEKIARE